KRKEVRGGIVVTEAGNIEIFRYNLVTLSHELFGKNLCKRLKTYSHHLQRSRQRQRVLLDLAAASLRELIHRQGTKLGGGCVGSGPDRVCVVNNSGSRFHLTQVQVHEIMIEGIQQVDALPETRRSRNPGSPAAWLRSR